MRAISARRAAPSWTGGTGTPPALSLQARYAHVAIVFNELQAHHLHLMRSKCSFGTPSVACLGHVISAKGVAMDAAKVAVVAA